jgi:hypothetical protein
MGRIIAKACSRTEPRAANRPRSLLPLPNKGDILALFRGSDPTGEYLIDSRPLQEGDTRNNLNVYGYTVDWDGATSSVLAYPIVLTGDFEIEIVTLLTNYTSNRAWLGNSTVDEGILRVETSGIIKVFIDGSSFALTSLVVPLGELFKLTIAREGDVYSSKLLNLETDELQSRSDTVVKADPTFNISEIGCRSDGTLDRFDGQIHRVSVKDESNQTVLDVILESAKDSTEPYAYDRVTGQQVTFDGYTVSPWKARKSGSLLLACGFVDNDPVNLGYIPASLTNPLVDPFGNALTHLPGKVYPDSHIELEAPDSAELLAADTESQLAEELIKDPGFDGLGWWLETVSAEISGGKLNVTDSATGAQGVNKSFVLEVGKFYQIGIDVDYLSEGNIKVYCGIGSVETIGLGQNQTFILECIGDHVFRVYGSVGGQSYTVDNVSVREVKDPINLWYEDNEDKNVVLPSDLANLWNNPTATAPDPNIATWDQATGIGRIVATIGDNTYLSVPGVVEIGATYRVKYEVLETDGGSLALTTLEGYVLTESVEIDLVANDDYLQIKRSTLCDVTFKLSITRSYNDQYFYGERALLIFKEPRTTENAAKATTYVKPF